MSLGRRPLLSVISNALLSPDGVYRYALVRQWSDAPPVVWVLLNPSTADAETDDPTIRRVTGFSRSWGAGGALVVNLFALRSTDPAALLTHPDPVGPDNDTAILTALRHAKLVVCGWGGEAAKPRLEPRAKHVWHLLTNMYVGPARISHLGMTKSGHPRHPLYLRGDELPR